MNRNNFFIHVGIAVVIVTLAAVLGQIRRWETSLTSTRTKVDSVTKAPAIIADEVSKRGGLEPEVLVRFKPGVRLEDIKKIAARNHDVVEDEIESVKGLVAIDDLSDADAADVAKQYSAMSQLVEYAQPNYEISIEE